MASEPMTEAGKRLLEAHGDAAVYCGMGDENLTPLILAIEAEAADLPRRWPKGPTDRDGNPLPATPAETGLREAAQRLVDMHSALGRITPGLLDDLRTALSKEEK